MDVAVTDLGQVRGLALFRAKGARFRHIAGDAYYAPSATSSGGYVCDAAKKTCSCPSHEDSGQFCKHLWAIAYFRQELAVPDDEQVVSKAVRPTYKQNWPAYNRAQCQEKEQAQILLRELCDGIAQPKQELGRPRIQERDAVFCVAWKVYVGMSGRRAMTDLRACQAAGYVAEVPSFASLFRTMERADLTPVLRTLVEQSAIPLRALETTFAADGTGFATTVYTRWFAHRYGGENKPGENTSGEEKRHQQWIKVHAMIGTLTNVIVAVNVTEGFVNDSPEFPALVERTAANGFDMQEVSADKAYLSHENLAHVEKVGARPFIPFKSNSTGSGSPAWERLWHLYSLQREEFLAKYHRRSNVEATFSAIKRKFGPSLRSRNLAAQYNEALLKCLCFNLSILVHSIYELGIEPKFWMPKEGTVVAR